MKLGQSSGSSAWGSSFGPFLKLATLKGVGLSESSPRALATSTESHTRAPTLCWAAGPEKKDKASRMAAGLSLHMLAPTLCFSEVILLWLSKWFVLKQIEKFRALSIIGSANMKQNCIQLLPQQILLLSYCCRTGPAECTCTEPGGDCSSPEVRDKLLVLTHVTSRYSPSVSLVLDIQKYARILGFWMFSKHISMHQHFKSRIMAALCSRLARRTMSRTFALAIDHLGRKPLVAPAILRAGDGALPVLLAPQCRALRSRFSRGCVVSVRSSCFLPSGLG